MHSLYGVLYLVCLPAIVFGQIQNIELRLADLESFLIQNSLVISQLNNHLEQESAKKSLDLLWSNPELEFEYESLSHSGQSEFERNIIINKNFTLPWIYFKKKKSWNYRLNATRSSIENFRNEFISDMKSQYVQIKILEQQVSTLHRIHLILKDISEKSMAMRNAGTFSGMDQSLLQMALFNLDSEIMQLQTDVRASKADFKQRAGIASDVEMVFSTPIRFPISLPDSTDLINLALRNHPSIAQFKYLKELHQTSISLARLSAIESVSIGGGYKNTSNNFKGFTLHVGIPLPVMNRNSITVQLERLQQNKTEIDYQLFREKLKNRVIQQYQRIKGFEHTLNSLHLTRPHSPITIDQIISSYQEGWSNLTEMLSGIELYQSFLNTHLQLIQSYYESIIELEYLSGITLINEE